MRYIYALSLQRLFLAIPQKYHLASKYEQWNFYKQELYKDLLLPDELETILSTQ